MKKCTLILLALYPIAAFSALNAGFSAKIRSSLPRFFSKKTAATVGISSTLCSLVYAEQQNHNATRLKQEKLEAEWADIIKNSEKLNTYDPEMWNIYSKIKNDLGITENVDVLVVPSNYEIRGDYVFNAMYSNRHKAILLRAGYHAMHSGPSLVFILAHELEHHKQNLKYPGSYHGDTGAKEEHGADAAAAGYLECAECLKAISKRKRDYKDNDLSRDNIPDRTLRKICRTVGYFGEKDFAPYIQRAESTGCLCTFHTDETNILNRVQVSSYMPKS